MPPTNLKSITFGKKLIWVKNVLLDLIMRIVRMGFPVSQPPTATLPPPKPPLESQTKSAREWRAKWGLIPSLKEKLLVM